MSLRYVTLLLSSTLIAALAACSGQPDQRATPSPVPTSKLSTPSATPTPTRAVAPLTGLPVTSVAQRPALVVKIENSLPARPQTGLDKADIVVEELVEGGITRFAAMFQSRDPGTVGPVRSLRDVDAAIASPTRGLLASSGAASVVLKRLRKAPVQLITPSSGGSAYSRSKARSAPHNLYAKASGLWSRADEDHRKPPPPYLPFAPDAAAATTSSAAAKPATQARLTFSPASHPRWAYDPASGRWLRSEGSTPARTSSGARITAANVLIMSVKTRDAGYRDPVGNPVPETIVTGSGALTVLSAGRRITGTWHKASAADPLSLTTAAGAPLLIAPGTSWLELVPAGGSAKIS